MGYKKILLGLGLVVLVGVGGWFLAGREEDVWISPLLPEEGKLPYEELTFEALEKREFTGGEMRVGVKIKEEAGVGTYFFDFLTEGKRVSGALNLPLEKGRRPVVVMLRGYADKEIYFTGLGTRKLANYLAGEGMITLAPDFLGFGNSESESLDVLEARFRRPETVLSLLASLKNLNEALTKAGLAGRWDEKRIFLWGHSNGGQIALSVLEITGESWPTVLWAPVTAGFPESVLEFLDASEEGGQKVLRAIRNLEARVDLAKFSIAAYWDQLEAPMAVLWGEADEYIPRKWRESFEQEMGMLEKEVFFYNYEGDNHNLSSHWEEAAFETVEFYKKFF